MARKTIVFHDGTAKKGVTSLPPVDLNAYRSAVVYASMDTTKDDVVATWNLYAREPHTHVTTSLAAGKLSKKENLVQRQEITRLRDEHYLIEFDPNADVKLTIVAVVDETA